jgi:membrane associated rhomboid family serine protease
MLVIRVPALFLLGFWFFIQNVLPGLGSLVTTASNAGGVAFWAHIGGFIAGFLVMTLYLAITRRRALPNVRRIPWRWSRW